jgi:hypothetical protein
MREVMKNVLTFLKLSKNKKILRKAGWVDDNGNLTDDGMEVLGNVLLETYEDQLVDLAKDFIKENKNESSEEN